MMGGSLRLWRLGVRNLRLHPLRSSLTILGILVFSGLTIAAIIRNRPVTRWLAWLAGITLFYILSVWITAIT